MNVSALTNGPKQPTPPKCSAQFMHCFPESLLQTLPWMKHIKGSKESCWLEQDITSFSLHLPSFLTVYLLFKCRFVVWQKRLPRNLVVLSWPNKHVILDLLCVWILFQYADSHSCFRFLPWKVKPLKGHLLEILYIRAFIHRPGLSANSKHWFTTPFTPTTAIIDYAMGLEKLSDNEQFFVGSQMAVSSQKTTQMIPGVSFITTRVTYASTDISKITWVSK